MNDLKSHNPSSKELQPLIVEWNDNRTDYPHNASIQELFEAQAEQNPDETAVVFEDNKLTYAELNRRANQLAHYLRAQGIGPDIPVAILVERTCEMVVGWLGILKAGGAYVPIDPSYPGQRLAHMLKDSKAPVLLTMTSMKDHLPDYQGRILSLDSDTDEFEGEPVTNPCVSVSAANLAYVIYTSGSTGEPKGVAVPHRAVIRLVCKTDYLQIEASDRVVQASNASFDAATFEIWGVLLNGAKLVGVARETMLNPEDFADFLDRQRITVMFITTALFNQMAREVPKVFCGLRALLFGGEAADPSWVRQVLGNGPPRRLLHVYGPTETTTFATWHEVKEVPDGALTVPIGIPIANSQAYVLDRDLQPVSVGDPGELYLGGDGLAREYLNEPELTAERFIPDPFSNGRESRLYRTGDTVRYLSNGSIEFLGRIDNQVKIHGFRIEPGEIEAILSLHPGVNETVVMVREDKGGEKRLVAYLVLAEHQEPSRADLRDFLKERLPDYMLPHTFIELDNFPINPNGKVDRRALPIPDWHKRDGDLKFVAPTTPLEEMLAGIWGEMLGVSQVSRDDNFFEFGGHSLIASRLISRVREAFNVELPIMAVFDAPTVAELGEIIKKECYGEPDRQFVPIQTVSRDQELPLSCSQERVWFIQQLDASSLAYNFQATFRFSGNLSIAALEASLSEIVRRHEILRTTFLGIDGKPVQVIHQDQPESLTIVDLQEFPENEREAEAQRFIQQEVKNPFDLTQLPLVRWTLLQLSKEEYILVHVEHHLLHDGWSFNVFLNELLELYKAFSNRKPSPLAELPIQFADFAHWQQEWIQGKTAETQLTYWKKKLGGSPPELNLPYDRPRPSMQTFRGKSLRVELPLDLCEALRELSRQESVTLFMTMEAAFLTLLHRYSGQDDICVGLSIANRRWRETEALIGMILNNLVLRTNLSGNPTFRELLVQIRGVILEAYASQDVPFDKVVEALQPVRDISRNPLFQVMFSFHDSPLPSLELPELNIDILLGLSNESAKFDMNVIAIPRAEQRVGQSSGDKGITLLWEYNTDLFDESTITRMIGHYQTLLKGFAADPGQHISTVPLLSEAEKHQVLVDWNNTSCGYPSDKCLHQLFEQQVEQTPDAVAVVCEDEQLSYRELNTRSNQLAHYLIKLGVGPEVLVAICLERCLEMVVALMGILKAGGAYVPLDPAYPKGRFNFILNDTQAEVLLTKKRLIDRLPDNKTRVVCLDSDWDLISGEKRVNPKNHTSPENLAYMIYTSGSTGQPKGVMIRHQGLTNYIWWAKDHYLQGQALDFPLFSPLSFDLTVTSIYTPLLSGARIVVYPEQEAGDLAVLQVIEDNAVDVIKLTPAHLALVEPLNLGLSRLKKMIVGGEDFKRELAMSISDRFNGRIELYNEYGPTETVVGCMIHRFEPTRDLAASVPIGRPVANTQIYILDQNQRPVPIGVTGEIVIAGDGVARGYFNQPELSAESFAVNPFRPGTTMYRTGDLSRFLADGRIEFLGRVDHQVKLKGYRIELGEIEAVLAQHPNVAESVALVREDDPGEQRLVGYVVSHEPSPPSHGELKEFLQQKLPSYMIPSAFVLLDALPLTPNGKVDRPGLPMPDGVRPKLAAAYQAPRGKIEQTLAHIWKKILRIDQVGRQDNFFELGGDSILSIQIVARANQAGLRVTPKHIFQHQTIAELAEVVEAIEPVTADQGVVTGPLPLSPIQHWFFGRQLEEPNHWNMAWVLETKQPVDPKKMEQVVEALLRHHDALRLRFVPRSTGWKQEMGAPGQTVPFTFIDLSHVPNDEAAVAFNQEADRLHTTLNLSEGPLIQVALFNFSENQADRVLLVIHHLAVDGISWRILLDDLQTAYDQLCEKGSIQLPPKTTSFKEWAEGLLEYAQSNKLREEVSYWGAVANTSSAHLPRDLDGGINTVASTRTVSVELGQEDTRALLQEIPEVYHTQINDVLLAALVDALAQWSRQEAICLNLEGHGREELLEDIDLSRTVGWFTAIFPVVLKRDKPGHPGELLKSVKEQLRQIPHRGIGYGLLRYVSEDGKVRDHLGDGLVPELSFNYLGQFDQVIPVDGQWSWSEASGGANRNPLDRQSQLIAIGAWIMNNVLQVHWIYSENVHRRETIENLAKNYLTALVKIIRHCQSPEAGGYTPSDFPLARVSQSDLDKALVVTKSGDGKAVPADLYALTPLQQGLWFHALVDPESGVYVEQGVFHIGGDTNRDVLRQAWEKVVEQHVILRTGIIWEGLEHPLQFVRSTVELPWTEVDWREIPEHEYQSRLLKFLDEDRLRGFDLTQAPLMRLTLIQVAETSAILVWSFHHLILDRWSVDLVQQDLWSAYHDLVQGQPLQLNASRPYREYLGWLQDQDHNRAEQYWRRLLSGFTEPTVLGVDQAPPTRVGHQERSFNSEEVALSEAATSALSSWARQHQLTLNTLVQGALAVLLSRYSGSEDVVFGITVSGRSAELPGIESMVGLFLNTLPVRVHVAFGHSVVPWLTELQEQQVTLREYGYTPLYEIQQWSEVPAGKPLFNTLLVFENIPLESGGNLAAGTAGLNVQRVTGSRGGETNYALTVAVVPGRKLQVQFMYDTEHYTAEAITRMVGHFQQMLTGMIGGREQTRLGAIPLLSYAERQRMLVEWNATETNYPNDRCVHQLFEQQVEQSPDAVAVVYGDQQLTYRQLNVRANQLARYLNKLGVGPEVLVGIYLERSLEMMIALMGILKAGGAYVPLDPAYPAERLAFILSDAQIPVLLTQKGLVDTLPVYEGDVICLDKDVSAIAQQSEENPASGAAPANLVYVIYTSGSTGTPKGVMVEHGSLVNYIVGACALFELKPDDRILQFSSISFDAAAEEIYPCLIRGAALHLRQDMMLSSVPHFLEACSRQGITVLDFPTAFWHQIASDLAGHNLHLPESVRLVLIGGERAVPQRVADWQAHLGQKIRLMNGYGPTEATIVATFFDVTTIVIEDGRQEVPIGRPVNNVRTYVLDKALQPVPVGVAGELHIGGEGLARGYLNRPELTAQKFIPDPFNPDSGARIYKTGDLVRYLSDGNLEFLGRIDYQVKIRGFRIELGEIESVLGRHPAVEETVVIAREDVPGDKRLVAYVVASHEPTPTFSELRSFLKEKLPDYMIPTALVFLDLLPLTTIGKVDRRALPLPDAKRPDIDESFAAPRNAVEQALAEIWGEILGIEKVGIQDNFFELGGHSLMATQIISRLSDVFQVKIPLRQLFLYPTIAELALIIAGEQEKSEQENVKQLLDEFEDLSDEEAERLLAQDLRQNEEADRSE